MLDDTCSYFPEGPDSPRVRVGQNSHGEWIVQDEGGRYGGIFVDRSEALKYALFENGHRRRAVMMISGILELEIKASDHGYLAVNRNH